jgi:hypothetical protein
MREPTTQVAFRLADRLVKRIEAHARRMERAAGRGVKATMADAVRDLLTRALDEAERAAGEGGAS